MKQEQERPDGLNKLFNPHRFNPGESQMMLPSGAIVNAETTTPIASYIWRQYTASVHAFFVSRALVREMENEVAQ